MKSIMKYMTSYKLLLTILFVSIFTHAITQLYLPALMGEIVDRGVVTGNIRFIWQTGVWMFIVATVGIVMSIVMSYLASTIAIGIGRDIRNELFQKITHLSLFQFEQLGTATLITRTTNDVNQIQQAFIMSLRMFLTAPFMFFGGLLMALTQDIQLTFVVFIMVPFLAIAIFFIFKYGHPLFKQVQQKLDQLNVIFRENLTGVRVIRSFVKEKVERWRLNQANSELTTISLKVNRFLAFAMPFMMLLMNVTIVLVIWVGAHRIDHGHLEIGALMAFIQYVMLIMFSLMMASMMFVILPRASVSWQRIKQVLQVDSEEIQDGTHTLSDETISVTFEDVQFTYPGANYPAIDHVNFTLKSGSVTAVVGGTGSGKTTLVQLLLRFYDVTEGNIVVNGNNIRELKKESLRERIGYVPQQTQLFSGTIKENIRYGNEFATDEEIILAAKIVEAHPFIERFPDGYDTYIEQGGANLSGGQKQRLAIARAIVRNPSLYIFDDSFSALDYETDRNVREHLKEVTKDAAVLIVAQRVSTIMEADQIIVLDQGKMVAKGTHEQLLAESTVYQEIVSSQVGEGESA